MFTEFPTIKNIENYDREVTNDRFHTSSLEGRQHCGITWLLLPIITSQLPQHQ